MHTRSFASVPLFLLLTALLSVAACGGDKDKASVKTTGASCSLDGDCDSGQTCVDSICTSGFTANADITNTADGGDSDAGTATTDVKASADTGADPAKTGGDCASCAKTSECAEGYGCLPLLNNVGDEGFCLKKCSANSECTNGLTCQLQTTGATQKFCIPTTFRCEGCAVDGCPGKEECDFSATPPKCLKVGALCAECQLTKDCGAGMVCVKQGGQKICATSCGGGEKCPANSACIKFGANIDACSYTAATCCFGDTCKGSDACGGCPDKCVSGACAECVKDSDCDKGTCIASTHTCQKATCPAEKPQKLATGVCVECANDTHCGGSAVGPKCIGNKCTKSGVNSECSVCKTPYPGCVEINGAWSCVECATDDDCAKKKKGSCSAKTFTCSGTVANVVTKGTCKADADCKAGTSGFDLVCDTDSGLCYDKKGQCDNIVAFCKGSANSVCKPFDLLGLGNGGGLPSIPGLPSGGASSTGAGVCSCGGSTAPGGKKWDDSLCKAFSLTKCDCAKDAASKDCDPAGLGSCCQSAGGGGGSPINIQCIAQLLSSKPDPACFGGKTCSDLSCITGAAGGGGAGKGGYCADPSAP